MFKKLLARAAAKASLANMKFDLDRLSSAFPQNPSVASKALFTLMENISLAFGNQATVVEVQTVISARSGAYPSGLTAILDDLVELTAAVERGDSSKVSECDKRINELFLQATGSPLDASQLPWFTKLALKSKP